MCVPFLYFTGRKNVDKFLKYFLNCYRPHSEGCGKVTFSHLSVRPGGGGEYIYPGQG